jgi:formate hydrogenlyase subunit 3/multisubunit Na+/H+ antiporter MnhD subunit
VASNLIGLSQHQPNRLLGYSSIGQIGLVVSIIGMQPILGDKAVFIGFTILLTHLFAKAGLFWLSGIVGKNNIKHWSALRRKPILLMLFGTFVFALIGFPPFPSFYGKWELIMNLSATQQYYLIAAVLIGSFIEAVYLFRWLGYSIKLDYDDLPELNFSWYQFIPVVFWGGFLYGTGIYTSHFIVGLEGLNYLPLLFIALIYFMDGLPAYFKNILVIAGMVFYSWQILPGLYATDMLRFIFAGIFLIGGILTFIAGFAYKGKRIGFYPVALLMYAGLAILIQASTTLEFFFGWELMTAGSYFLIIRGKRSMPHGLSYMLFSIAGAYAILAAFGLSYAGTLSIELSSISLITKNVSIVFILLAVGFMTKTASLGLHIWLPGAHAEAESDVSPMVSAILLKAGVFGLMILMIALGHHPEAGNIAYVLGWLGAITALVGNLAAAFQEDAKRLLAYSSISQLGYILFALAMMSHLGWMTAMVYSVNHFLYKAILFLTIGAVVLKVGTHDMYKMGGLIKKMPMAFIAVLIGIIALSGVPPLSGFAGKWLFYNAVIDKHWYFQGAIVFFSGIIAFLYLFKLIYSVFLGQLKDNLRHVTDISVWFAIPIYILIIGIMIFSAKPEWVLQPLGNMIGQWYPNGALAWNGGMATAPYGYWNGTGVMITIGILFMVLFSWLYILSRKAVKVSQFNIVYAAEAPQRPETTHVSYNIYAGYNKALGWIVAPKITEFWEAMTDWVHSLALYGRLIYNGNGQVYLLYVMAYFLTIYFLIF